LVCYRIWKRKETSCKEIRIGSPNPKLFREEDYGKFLQRQGQNPDELLQGIVDGSCGAEILKRFTALVGRRAAG
jgi:hypothetical protein